MAGLGAKGKRRYRGSLVGTEVGSRDWIWAKSCSFFLSTKVMLLLEHARNGLHLNADYIATLV